MKIIQRLKKTKQYLDNVIKYTTEPIKESITPYINEVNTEGYILRKNDKFVSQNKSIFAVMTLSDFIQPDGEVVTYPLIVTDNLYDELSENTKRFIILHELGHFKFQLDKLRDSNNYKRNIEYECQADMYAVPELGKENVIKALNEIKNIVFIPESSHEIRKRIKNIKKNI